VREDVALVAAADRGELILARGRFGGRPLYYATHAPTGALVASSELGPLASLLGATRVDNGRLSAFLLGTTLVEHSRTFFADIRRVPSACAIRLGPRGVVERRDTPFDVVPRRSGSADDLAVELREHILRAVERSIDGAEGVGVLVSGGLDSSAVLAAALTLTGRAESRVRALNLDFGGPGDDRPHLRALCDAFGIAPVRVPPRACASALHETFVVDRAPMSEPTTAVTLTLAREHRARGGSRLLTGTAGDAIFGGDMGTFARQAQRGHPIAALRAAARLKAWGVSTARSRVDFLVVRPLVKAALPLSLLRRATALNRRRRAPVWAGERLKGLLAGGAFDDGTSSRREGKDDRSWLDPLSRSAAFLDYSEFRSQVELKTGCQWVDPVLDVDLVEFLASLPPETLFHGGYVRGLLRLALRGLVPESLRLRTDKAGFESALVELMESAGGFATLEPLADTKALADLRLVEPRRFRERFDQLVRAPLDEYLWPEVWPVLAAEAFVRQVGSA
jgi:asparagine synthase (glutamine-hydrolysing)